MSDANASPADGWVRPRNSGSWWQWSIILIGISLVAAAYGWRWADYRFGHVVSHDALVRGSIAKVGSRLDGRIASIAVYPNQRVRKGDVIAKLEDEHLIAAVSRIQAKIARVDKEIEVDLAEIEQSRRSVQIDIDRCTAELAACDLQTEAAEKLAARWAREISRISKVSTKVVSVSEREEIQSQHDAATANVRLSESKRQVVEQQLRAARNSQEGLSVRTMRSELASESRATLEADLAAAKAELESSTIRAPDDGWVAERIAEPGSSVRIGDSIVALWVGNKIWVEAWVPESSLGHVAVGSTVDVRVAAHPNKTLIGQVEALGVISDYERSEDHARPVQRGYSAAPKIAVRIKLPDSELRLMPGLSAMVGIHAGSTSKGNESLVSSVGANVKTASN